MRAATWALVMMTCVRAPPPVAPPPPPAPAPAPPAPDVPPGCLGSLAGTWRSPEAPLARYEADDDGGTARFVAFSEPIAAEGPPPRRFSRLDGGLAWLLRDGGGPTSPLEAATPRALATLVLSRSAAGFAGVTRSVAGPTGCVPSFPARVLSCDDDELTVETITSARFDAECRQLDGGVWTTRTLRRARVDAGPLSPDASWADGG